MNSPIQVEIVRCKHSQRFKVKNCVGYLKLLSGGLALDWTQCKRATGFRLKADAEQMAASFGLVLGRDWRP